jgi:hypothetical protein
MSQLDITEPKSFNSLMRYLTEFYDTNKSRWRHFYEDDIFFQRQWEGIPGLINISRTLFVFEIKELEKIESEWNRKAFDCAEIGYKDRFFQFKGLDCDYDRDYVYFALRVVDYPNEELDWIVFLPKRANDEGVLLIKADQFGVLIAPRRTRYKWYECEECNAILEIDEIDETNDCPRCGSHAPWRWLVDA